MVTEKHWYQVEGNGYNPWNQKKKFIVVPLDVRIEMQIHFIEYCH